jgi:outer membrane protein assembly factor BamE (lipoprotein component of BamABCDE complex)
LAALGATILAACQPIQANRGVFPDEDRLAQIEVGQSTRVDMIDILGPPTTRGIAEPQQQWFYISQQIQQTAFLPARVVDQQVLVVSFDDQGRVRALDQLTGADGLDIAYVGTATPTQGQDASIIAQIFGNLGRLPTQSSSQ